MMIINSGIQRVVCEKHYHADKDTIALFKLAGIELVVMNEDVEEYERQ
jgi:dCMP deaminase